LKTVSARTYDRNLTDKLYDISKNVGQQQLQNIIDENIKIEDEMNLNAPSSSSSAFSDLSSFKEEPKLPGDFEDESGGETETESATEGESHASNIFPEDPNLLIQNNNSNISIARPKANFVPKERTEGNLLRTVVDHQMDNMGISAFK
jgi:hypothetical protein